MLLESSARERISVITWVFGKISTLELLETKVRYGVVDVSWSRRYHHRDRRSDFGHTSEKTL